MSFRTIIISCVISLFSMAFGQTSIQLDNCNEGVEQLIEECPQIEQLTQLASELVQRSIVQEKEFPPNCCQIIAQLNEAKCFCEDLLVGQFSRVAGDEFLPSLLYQASQVEPAGCSIKIKAAFDSKKCTSFGNTVFPQDIALTREQCTQDNLISDVLAESQGLQFFLEAIDLLDLQTQLDLLPSITIFAPSDAAFSAWAAAEGIVPEDLFADEELLVTVLARHIVVNATVFPSMIKDPERFKTLQGSFLNTIAKDGDLLVQGYPMLDAGVPACNGVLYRVDSVLWPENKTAETEEAFAPVVKSPSVIMPLPEEEESEILQAPLPEFVKSKPTGGQVKIQSKTEVVDDDEDDVEVPVDEGEEDVMGLTDAVGMSRAVQEGIEIAEEPCDLNVYQLTTQFLPLFSKYLSYADQQDLATILERSNGITVAIPINTAFAGTSEQELSENWSPLNHIIMDELSLNDFGQLSTPLVTLGGTVSVSTRPSGKVVIGGAEIVQSDVVGCNGRLQVVGQLILNEDITPLNDVEVQQNLNAYYLTSSDGTRSPEEVSIKPSTQIVEELDAQEELLAPSIESNTAPNPDLTVPPYIRKPTPRPTLPPTQLDPTAPSQNTYSTNDAYVADPVNATIDVSEPQSTSQEEIQMPSPQVFNKPENMGPGVPLKPPAVFYYTSPQQAPIGATDTPVAAPQEYEGINPDGALSAGPTQEVNQPQTPAPIDIVEPTPGSAAPSPIDVMQAFIRTSPSIDIEDPSPILSPSPSPLPIPSPSPSPMLIPSPSPPVDFDPPCSCTEDGYSGGIDTGKIGCQEFVEGWPSFCYVANPYGCFLSKPSQRFIGARWRNCTVVEDDVGIQTDTQYDILNQVAESSPLPVAPSPTDSNSGPCSCSPTGTSGNVQTGRPGCVEHVPGYSPFCYVLDPPNCFVARESTRYPTAGWRYCAQPSQEEKPAKPDNVVRVTILPVFDPITGTSKYGMFLTPKDN